MWCPEPDPSPASPRTILPKGSVDSHCHLFGPIDRFPYAVDAPFTPPEAGRAVLERLHRALGIERAVLVQSACHGSDHAVLYEALEAGAGRYRGVALASPTTPAKELRRLADAGVCGARVHFAPHIPNAPDAAHVEALARIIGGLGWHLEVHVVGDALLAMAPVIRRLDLPVVIDHLARPDHSSTDRDAVTEELLALVATGNVWVKLSAWYRLGEAAPWPYARELSAELVAVAPSRLVWGTDFPHPNIIGAAPHDADLVDGVAGILPDAGALRAVFVDNPAALFGFE
jgi:2-pyrone-4,6-dicarboxylate lactonase